MSGLMVLQRQDREIAGLIPIVVLTFFHSSHERCEGAMIAG